MRMFDPEVVWRLSGVFPDFTGSLHGQAAVRRFWEEFTEPWERIELEGTAFRHEGDWTIVDIRFCATGRDGLVVELPQVHALRFREGLVVEYRSFRELEEARASVLGE